MLLYIQIFGVGTNLRAMDTLLDVSSQYLLQLARTFCHQAEYLDRRGFAPNQILSSAFDSCGVWDFQRIVNTVKKEPELMRQRLVRRSSSLKILHDSLSEPDSASPVTAGKPTGSKLKNTLIRAYAAANGIPPPETGKVYIEPEKFSPIMSEVGHIGLLRDFLTKKLHECGGRLFDVS